MAMNKKEKAFMEELKTLNAFKLTEPVLKDVPIPTSGLVTGWFYNAYSKEVSHGCSSSVNHSVYNIDKTRSQGPVEMYSTKLLALKAMRYAVELDCARNLRAIDIRIEKAINGENKE